MMPGYVGLIPRGASMRYPIKIKLSLIDLIVPVLGKDMGVLVLSSGREIDLEESTLEVEARIEEAREVAERHEQKKLDREIVSRKVHEFRQNFPEIAQTARSTLRNPFGRAREIG